MTVVRCVRVPRDGAVDGYILVSEHGSYSWPRLMFPDSSSLMFPDSSSLMFPDSSTLLLDPSTLLLRSSVQSLRSSVQWNHERVSHGAKD